MVDIFDVKAAFHPLLQRLDHCLNEIEGLGIPRRRICLCEWDRIKPKLPEIAAFVVYETG